MAVEETEGPRGTDLAQGFWNTQNDVQEIFSSPGAFGETTLEFRCLARRLRVSSLVAEADLCEWAGFLLASPFDFGG